MDNSAGFIKKAREEINRHGMSGLFRTAWHKTSPFLWYTTCSIWYERDLGNPILPVTPGMHVEIEFLVRNKTKLIEWLVEKKTTFPWIYWEKELEAAHAHHHVFLILTHQGCIIGYVKIGLGRIYIQDFDQAPLFQPKTAFIYDTFVLPEYRGKRLALFGLEQISRYFKEKNYTKILCHIEKWNVGSVRAFEGAGYQAWESIRFIRLAGVSFFLRRTFLPFLNLEHYLKPSRSSG